MTSITLNATMPLSTRKMVLWCQVLKHIYKIYQLPLLNEKCTTAVYAFLNTEIN